MDDMARETFATTGEAQLHYDGQDLAMRVIEGTEHERAIDIAQLRSKTGLITLDPGFGNTGACRSAITFIDGDRGILRYRGYPIEELAEKSTFLEVAWLLINGDLPTATELDAFRDSVRASHDAARGLRALLRRLAEGRASHGGVRGGRRRARDLLPGLPENEQPDRTARSSG